MAVTLDQIRTIIAEQFALDPSVIKEESLFVEDLGADSIDSVELIMAFETAFAIEIPNSDAVKLRSVNDVLHYLNSRGA